MNRWTKGFALCLAILLFLMPMAVGATESTAAQSTEEKPAPALKEADLTHAKNVLLYCIETDTILREKNAEQSIQPLTATKLMTALLAHERISDLKAEITVTKEMVKGVSGTYYGFQAGDKVSAEDLIKLMLLRKSNDAAMILACTVAGDLESFVALMNERARLLGMEQTHFANCTGLVEEEMTTTAGDLLMLALEFYSNDELLRWSGSGDLQCESLDRKIYNNNFFLSRYYNGTGTSFLFEAVSGIINGGTDELGDLLITSAANNGLHYIVVLTGGEKVEKLPKCYEITRELIEKDTLNFAFTKVLTNAEVIGELPVYLGSGADYAAVFPKETLEYYLPLYADSAKFKREIEYTVDRLEAPVEEGNTVGRIKVYYDGVLLGETDLVVRSNISRSGAEYRVKQITTFLSGKLFATIALSVIGVVALYFVATAIYRERVKKKIGKDELY